MAAKRAKVKGDESEDGVEFPTGSHGKVFRSNGNGPNTIGVPAPWSGYVIYLMHRIVCDRGVPEVAEVFGEKVTQSSVKRWIKTGEIPERLLRRDMVTRLEARLWEISFSKEMRGDSMNACHVVKLHNDRRARIELGLG